MRKSAITRRRGKSLQVSASGCWTARACLKPRVDPLQADFKHVQAVAPAQCQRGLHSLVQKAL